MPMDIRSFFGKKGSGAAPKPRGAALANDNSKSAAAAKTAITKSKLQVAPNDNNDKKKNDGTNKNKQQVITLEDSDATTDAANEENSKLPASKQRNNKKALRIEDDDDDSDHTTDNNSGPTAAVSTSMAKSNDAKPQKQRINTTARTEITASDYFALSASSKKKEPLVVAQKQENKAVDLMDDSEDDLPKKRPSPSKKKRPSLWDDDDDDIDDDDDGGDKHDEDYQENNKDDNDDDDDFEFLKRKGKASSRAINKRSPAKSGKKQSPAKKLKPNSPSFDEEMEDDEPSSKTSKSGTPSRAASKRDAKTRSAGIASPTRKKQNTPASKQKKEELPKPLEPTLELDHYDASKAVPGCLSEYTFVFSGNLNNLSREESEDFVKTLGARVTSAVSSKTTYLVVGNILEDGRPYTEGSKYKKAMTFNGAVQIVRGETQLYGLAKSYSDKAALQSNQKENNRVVSPPPPPSAAAAPIVAAPPANPYAKKSTVTNPYAKKSTVTNPYARTSSNPYAKSSSSTSNPYSKGGASLKVEEDAPPSDPNALWVDRYAPRHTHQILGNKDCVTKLSAWLGRWEERFNNPQAIGKTFSNPQGPWKAALLSGPPGIGKTTTATLVAKEAGRDLLEYNASDVRSKKAMHESLGDITGSQSMEGFFQTTRKGSDGKIAGLKTKGKCIIMDEVDGMGGGDRGGLAELIQMIKYSRVPIICICNDRQSQKLKSLIPYCLDLRFRRPVKTVIAKQAIDIAAHEGLTVDRNAAELIAESCGNDIRQVVNALQMWASDSKGPSSSSMTYKELKDRQSSMNKDEMLRVSLFDAVRLILEGRRGLANSDAQAENDSFYKRNDAFFVDYGFTGLIVQQNYLKVMTHQHSEAKRANDESKVVEFMERMSEAASTMSDFAMVENKIRGGDMNWSLLPFAGVLAVKTGFHASGPTGAMYPGFPEFTAWLGKNSSMGKKQRIVQELKRHMNFKISGGTQEVRLSYLPFLRDRLLALLNNSNDDDRNTVAIQLMDEYGLDREDVFENLDEFIFAGGSKAPKFADMDSKSKAAFTREYNKLSHKSQALVDEQGAAKKAKRGGGGGGPMESVDPDAIDDDNAGEGDDEADEAEEDMAKLQAMFKTKGRKPAAKKATGGEGKGRKKEKF